MGQSLTIQIWPSRSMICALISPTFSFSRSLTSLLPLMISSRASMTHCGQSESVVRGQPSVGLVFCHDFSSGLSDHFGVNDGLGLYLLTDWIALNKPPANRVKPFSAYLTGRIIFLLYVLKLPKPYGLRPRLPAQARRKAGRLRLAAQAFRERTPAHSPENPRSMILIAARLRPEA